MQAERLILVLLKKEFEHSGSILEGNEGSDVWVMAATVIPFAETPEQRIANVRPRRGLQAAGRAERVGDSNRHRSCRLRQVDLASTFP